MLVGAFEIEVDGSGDFRSRGAHALEREPRVRPDIHHVRDFLVSFRFRAEQFLGMEREPGVDAANLHP